MRDLYPRLRNKEIGERLGRTPGSILIKAQQFGFKADRTSHWNDNWKFLEDNPYRRNLSVAQLGYIAGIIDGEGTVAVYRKRQRLNGRYHLSACNTNYALIQWLKGTIDYSIVVHQVPRNPKHSERWVWYLIGKPKVVALLTLLLPYLIVKREKAKELLRDWRECYAGIPG